MKKVLWPLFAYLLTAVLVLSSCTPKAPEAPAKTGTETITNAPVTLISIAVEPANPPELNPGSKQQFKAAGTYSDGTVKDISSQVTWKSSDRSIAVISAAGEAYGVARVSLPAATLPSDKPAALPPPGAPLGGPRPPPPGAGSSTPLISLTAGVMLTATLSGISSAPVMLTVRKAPLKDLPPLDAFMKGFNFADWAPFDLSTAPADATPKPPPPPGTGSSTPQPPSRELYAPPVADQSLIDLAATGANWIALLVRGGQETIASTKIFRDSPATASDEELRRMIDLAHALGIRVMLKPHVHLSQDPTHGHVQIGTTFTTEEQWQTWFESYRQFIIHYATLARDAGSDMFFIGQELSGTVHREADWRSIAQEGRQVYKGPIIYEATTNVNPLVSEESEAQWIDWWDAVDYIGVLGYFPLTQSNNPTVEELKSAWVQRGYLSSLEALSQKFQRPIIISEIGYLSVDGINTSPVPFSKFAQAPADWQEQADAYQAALEVLWGKPWLAGIFWWQWFADPSEAGLVIDKDRNESPQGKPAEEVVKRFYQSQRKP